MKNPNLVSIGAAISFIFLLVLIVTINNVTFEWSALAQSSGNETQVWIDRENNVKIFFTYSPENPVINAPTQLKFAAVNLLTGSHLKNLLAMVVITSNSSGHEKIFKFTNIIAPGGNFTLECLFPELGVYHVITRINSTNPSSITLASFRVIVTLETSFLNIIVTGIVILVIFGGVAYLVIIVKKKAKKKILG
ncbi:MAG TPA: hypothetical protein VEH06_08245 [Candidatus Bathyarchaeia archaeon]|nr:hypothetical protein [Candidatus Bathyarchaeia archaeon]